MPNAVVNISTATTTIVIAAPATGFIRILGLVLEAGGADNVTLLDNATALTGAFPMVAQDKLVLPVKEEGWYDCGVGNAFKILTSGAVQLSGSVRYELRQ